VEICLLFFSTDMPRLFAEEGRDGDDASKPADLIAASSSRLLGSWICEGAPVCCGGACRPQNDAAVLTEGKVLFVFSLLSSAGAATVGLFVEPKLLKVGASFLGVCGAVSMPLPGIENGFGKAAGLLIGVAGFSS